MQDFEKSQILILLEELTLYIKENSLNHIGIQIAKFNEILTKDKSLKDLYNKRIIQYNHIIKDKETKQSLSTLYGYIKKFSDMEICKNFIPEPNKNSIDGNLSSIFYSSKIDMILSCIINDAINIFTINFDGIITFYCKILYYACGSLINQNIDTNKMLEIQNDLLNLENFLNSYLIDCADFKILNFAKDNIDFSTNTMITNKIYQISLLRVIVEVKKYVKSLNTDFKAIKNSQLLDNLSKAEIELFNYLVKGYTIRKISSILNKSPNTLKTQQQSIFNKLNINNKNELIEKFTQNG